MLPMLVSARQNSPSVRVLSALGLWVLVCACDEQPQSRSEQDKLASSTNAEATSAAPVPLDPGPLAAARDAAAPSRVASTRGEAALAAEYAAPTQAAELPSGPPDFECSWQEQTRAGRALRLRLWRSGDQLQLAAEFESKLAAEGSFSFFLPEVNCQFSRLNPQILNCYGAKPSRVGRVETTLVTRRQAGDDAKAERDLQVLHLSGWVVDPQAGAESHRKFALTGNPQSSCRKLLR